MVIIMRVFYIFNIKKEFKDLYIDTPSVLFNILKQIYYLNDSELNYAKTLLNQLTNKLEKKDLDRYLFIKLHREMPYSKRDDTHYMNNLYKNEISKLKVRRSYIKIETESNFSSFFSIINNLDGYFFACDFECSDYFFINRIKILV